MNKEIMIQAGMGEFVKKVEMGLCPFCGRKVTEDQFRDRISKEEFRISGMCQVCQDEIFQDQPEGV